MVWETKHYKAGALKHSAFGRSELLGTLKGGERSYTSVDRLGDLSLSSVDWRISNQQADGKDRKFERYQPFFVEFLCKDLHQIKLPDGSLAFEVHHIPIGLNEDGPGSPANTAHCGLVPVFPLLNNVEEENLIFEFLRNQMMRAKRQIRSRSELAELVGEADPQGAKNE